MPVYSRERRLEVLAEAKNGVGTREIAAKFGCSESWVRRVKQEYREQGKTEPAQTRQRTPKWDAQRENIEQAIASQPDLTLAELKQRLGTDLSIATLCRALQTLKLTLKKSPDCQRTGSSRCPGTTCPVAGATARTRPSSPAVSR